MLESFFLVAQQVGVLFLLMGVGFALGKMGWLDERCAGQLSRLLIYVVAPCAIINALQTPYSTRIVSALIWGCFFLVFQYAGLIAISQLTFRREDLNQRAVLRFAQVYSNNVFMGIPLLQATLGAETAIFVVPSLVTFQVFQWTHGVRLMGGQLSVKRAIINPGIIGISIGLLLFFVRITLPLIPASGVAFLADMNTPLAMMIIGVQMAGADFRATFTQPRLYLVSAIRLLLAPLVTVGVMWPFHHTDPALFCALVILSAAPVAGATSIFAQAYERDITSAAHAITLSTLLSILMLPLFATLAQVMVA